MQLGQTSNFKSANYKRWQANHRKRLKRARATHLERVQRYKASIRPPENKAYITVPVNLDLFEGYNDFCNLSKEIQDKSFDDKCTIYLDFSKCQSVTVAASLVLLAEVERCGKCSNVGFFGNLPATYKAYYTLKSIGFYKYLQMRDSFPGEPKLSREAGPIHILNITSGVKDYSFQEERSKQINKAILKLLFGQSSNEPSKSKIARRVVGALQEAMQNSLDHAYPHENARWLRNKWWMTGYANTETGDIYLLFYDQGIGIPVSIVNEWNTDKGIMEYLKNLGQTPTDSQLIELATKVRVSSTKLKYRGRGLKQIKSLIQYSEPGGNLSILSGRGYYEFTQDEGAQVGNDRMLALSGTLIYCKLRNVARWQTKDLQR